MVKDYLFNDFLTEATINEMAEQMFANLKNCTSNNVNEEIKNKINEIDNKLKGYYKAIEDGLYNEDIAANVKALTDRKKILKLNFEVIPSTDTSNITKEKIIALLHKKFDYCLEDDNVLSSLVKLYIDKIKINTNDVEIITRVILGTDGGATRI